MRSLQAYGQDTISDTFLVWASAVSMGEGADTISDAEVFPPLLPIVRNGTIKQAAALILTFLGWLKKENWYAELLRSSAGEYKKNFASHVSQPRNEEDRGRKTSASEMVSCPFCPETAEAHT